MTFGLAQWIAAIGLDYTQPAIQHFINNEICSMYSQYCNSTTDPNGYYETPQDCMNFLGNITFGNLDWTMANTSECHFYHIQMAAYRPEVHCPHAEYTGGGICIDIPRSSFFEYYNSYSPDFVMNLTYVAPNSPTYPPVPGEVAMALHTIVSTPNSAPATHISPASSIGTIIGVTFGVAGLVLAVAGLLFYHQKKNAKKDAAQDHTEVRMISASLKPY